MEINRLQRNIVIQRNRNVVPFFIIIFVFFVIFGTVLLEIFIKGNSGFDVTYFQNIYHFPYILFPIFALIGASRYFWNIVTQQFLAPGPALSITQRGIQVGKLPHEPGSIFISWEEIEAIYVCRSFTAKFLCIRTKATCAFLSDFGTWKQWFKPIKLRTGASLNIQQDWIKPSAVGILQQIKLQYAQELHNHNIQLQ